MYSAWHTGSVGKAGDNNNHDMWSWSVVSTEAGGDAGMPPGMDATMHADRRLFWDWPPGGTVFRFLLALSQTWRRRGQRASLRQLWLGAAAQRLAGIDFPSSGPFSLTKGSGDPGGCHCPLPSERRICLPAGAVFCL